MEGRCYPSDVTDEQWKILETVFPKVKSGGRPRALNDRQIVNAILYIVRGGGAWRMLPKDFGAWETVYGFFWRFRRDGTWQRIHDVLREKVRRADVTGGVARGIDREKRCLADQVVALRDQGTDDVGGRTVPGVASDDRVAEADRKAATDGAQGFGALVSPL